MSTPDTQQQAYAQGYHVGYQHGFDAAMAQLRAGGGGEPPQGGSYPIDLVARYPERSSRLLMFFLLFRGFLLIPHLLCLWVLSMAVGVVMLVGWFAVIIMGSWPKGMWDFMAGYLRWLTRVNAYAFALTDEYPPFSLN